LYEAHRDRAGTERREFRLSKRKRKGAKRRPTFGKKSFSRTPEVNRPFKWGKGHLDAAEMPKVHIEFCTS